MKIKYENKIFPICQKITNNNKETIALFLVHKCTYSISLLFPIRSGFKNVETRNETKFQHFFTENIFGKRKIGFEGEEFRVLIFDFKFIYFFIRYFGWYSDTGHLEVIYKHMLNDLKHWRESRGYKCLRIFYFHEKELKS